MNAEFFVLAFGAALNPKLLAIDLLLARNRRARAMFVSVLAGGLSVALAIGLIDVLVIRADAIKAQRHASAGVDVALGVILLLIGALVAAGWLPRQRAGRATDSSQAPDRKKAKNGWAERVLREPRLPLAVVVGVLIGLPGALYLTALHHLVTGKWSTAEQVLGVIVFVVIEFILIIVPFLFLEFRPAGTTAVLERSQSWLLTHAKQLIAWIALLLGAYLLVSGLVAIA